MGSNTNDRRLWMIDSGAKQTINDNKMIDEFKNRRLMRVIDGNDGIWVL